MFALQLLEKLYGDSLESDKLYILVFHWKLISSGFGCIGFGDAKEISGDEETSELLPDEWKSEICMLRYVKDGKLYLARVNRLASDMIFNLIRADDMKIASSIIDVSEPLNESADKAALAKKLETDLLHAFKIPTAKKTDGSNNVNPLRREHIQPKMYVPPSPSGVGAADLDPFAAQFGPPGSGGMLFQIGERPGYSGIRYDPLIPPGPSILRPRPRPGSEWPGLGPRRPQLPGEPDYDHFPPPGYFS